jgi:hypothetical protein
MGNDPGIGEYRLKDFYLQCAPAASRQRFDTAAASACGQAADVLLA